MINLLKTFGRFSISNSRQKRILRTREAKKRRKASKQRLELHVKPQPDTPKIPFDLRPTDSLFKRGMDLVLQDANEEVKEAMSIDNASPSEVKAARIQEMVRVWGKNNEDTGHPAVQAAVLTEHIYALTQHLRFNHKDVTAFLKLRERIDQRRKALQYLSRYNYHIYYEVISALGIKDLKYPNHKEYKRMKIRPNE